MFTKASVNCWVVFAPVITTFPETNISKDTFGSTILYTNPGNNSGSYVAQAEWAYINPSRRMGNPASQVAVRFWTLKSLKVAGNPTFWTMAVYLSAALRLSLTVFAPVIIIFPLANISAVVRGSLILTITAWNRFGLYSAFLAVDVILSRSSRVPRVTVDTIFCNLIWITGASSSSSSYRWRRQETFLQHTRINAKILKGWISKRNEGTSPSASSSSSFVWLVPTRSSTFDCALSPLDDDVDMIETELQKPQTISRPLKRVVVLLEGIFKARRVESGEWSRQ